MIQCPNCEHELEDLLIERQQAAIIERSQLMNGYEYEYQGRDHDHEAMIPNVSYFCGHCHEEITDVNTCLKIEEAIEDGAETDTKDTDNSSPEATQ